MNGKDTLEIEGNRSWLRSLRGAICRRVDQAIIRSATARMPGPRGIPPQLKEAEQLLNQPDFFLQETLLAAVSFRGTNDFSFPSPVSTPYIENNRAYGHLYHCAEAWQTRPTLILLHGWNDSLTFYMRFPWLARRLNRLGFNCATLALPYHFERRPMKPGIIRNFISEDALRTMEAIRQGVADIKALAGWLRGQGCPKVGVWGISLGAWLGGLAFCTGSNIQSAVLMTPVARMDRIIKELSFVEPLRRSMSGTFIDLSRLNLTSHRPPTREVLLVQAEYDVFVPRETLEELWRAWEKPEMWRLPHGHISVLASNPVMKKAVRWLVQKG